MTHAANNFQPAKF